MTLRVRNLIPHGFRYELILADQNLQQVAKGKNKKNNDAAQQAAQDQAAIDAAAQKAAEEAAKAMAAAGSKPPF